MIARTPSPLGSDRTALSALLGSHDTSLRSRLGGFALALTLASCLAFGLDGLATAAPTVAAPTNAASTPSSAPPAVHLAGSKRPTVGGNYFLAGNTLDGQPFSVADLRGKVVLVYYWHTGCAVCLDKMPELRANVAGWQGKPFVIVMVHVDRERAKVADYWRTVKLLRPGEAMGPMLWRGDADFVDSLPSEHAQWPVSVLLDRQGRVAAYWEGRIPAEAWDSIADLMP
jgi:thiol-disulfide isomerase/thioredoxin